LALTRALLRRRLRRVPLKVNGLFRPSSTVKRGTSPWGGKVYFGPQSNDGYDVELRSFPVDPHRPLPAQLRRPWWRFATSASRVSCRSYASIGRAGFRPFETIAARTWPDCCRPEAGVAVGSQQWQRCANSGHCPRVRSTGQVDPNTRSRSAFWTGEKGEKTVIHARSRKPNGHRPAADRPELALALQTTRLKRLSRRTEWRRPWTSRPG
jgi:hypothetical protein